MEVFKIPQTSPALASRGLRACQGQIHPVITRLDILHGTWLTYGLGDKMPVIIQAFVVVLTIFRSRPFFQPQQSGLGPEGGTAPIHVNMTMAY